MSQGPEHREPSSTAPLLPAPARPPWYRTRAFNLALGTAVTVGCLWWAVRMMADGQPLPDLLRDLRRQLQDANYWTLFPMWVTLLLFYWIKAWRWRMLLTPLGRFPVRDLFPPIMIGFAFNNLLPAHLGDLVRIGVFSRKQRQPLAAVVTSVALERVLDAIAILILLGLSLLFVPDLQNPEVRLSMLVAAAGISVALAGAAVYLIWTRPFVALFERCLRLVPFLPERLGARLSRMLEEGADGLASLKHGPILAGLVMTSLVQWMLNVLVIHWSLASFGVHVSLLVSSIVMGVTAFGVVVPATPGYFGVIQVCFLAVLRHFTDDKVAVVAASIYYQLSQWIPVTAVGLFYFWRSGLQMAEVTHAAE